MRSRMYLPETQLDQYKMGEMQASYLLTVANLYRELAHTSNYSSGKAVSTGIWKCGRGGGTFGTRLVGRKHSESRRRPPGEVVNEEREANGMAGLSAPACLRRPTLVTTCLLLCILQTTGGLAGWTEPSAFLSAFRNERKLISAQDKADADAIIKEAFSTSIVYDNLAYLTDTFGPRISGSKPLEQAINWTKRAIEEDGLYVYEEPVLVPAWVRGNEYATLLTPRVKNVRIAGLGGTISTPNGKPIVAKVLVVSSFEDLQKQGDAAKGKIVVFNEEFVDYDTTVEYRYKAPGAAEKLGAVAVLLRSISPFGLQTVHTGLTDPAGIPAAAITLEDAKLFARFQARKQEVEIELYLEAHFIPDQPSRNLIIEIPGSEKPEEFVIFGGHLDSWDIAPGAMDDGGGAFISWEVIRLISKLGLKPKRTLRAILFVNEENGSAGGKKYASDHKDEANSTSIAIESDDGTFTPEGISFFGSKAARDILVHLGKTLLSSIGSGNVTTDESYGEDISYVVDQGVPGGSLKVIDPRIGDLPNNPCRDVSYNVPASVASSNNFLKSGYFWYHHTEADTIDKLSPVQLQHCAATLAVWTYAVANLPSLLPR